MPDPNTSSLLLWIYTREGRIKCLYYSEVSIQGRGLEGSGWVLRIVIDPKEWLEHLINDVQNPRELFEQLKHVPFNSDLP